VIKSRGEKIFDFGNAVFMLFVIVITVYPILYILSMSISDPYKAISGSVYWYPVGFDVTSYKMVFRNPEIFTAYYNTIWYTSVGTAVNLIMTVLAAYPLLMKKFKFRKVMIWMILIPMFFSGGIIPLFILMGDLNLINTRWAMILPVALDSFNVILCWTFFRSLPESLIESARIDGANDFMILWRIILPLSAPILAVLGLFYAVGHWNSYFNALMFLFDSKLQPIQLYLYKVISQSQDKFNAISMEGLNVTSAYTIQVKYAVIMVVVTPILFVYPFVQKYFVKGVLIGSLKE
jgi:putative aldouronate transport system permease protein